MWNTGTYLEHLGQTPVFEMISCSSTFSVIVYYQIRWFLRIDGTVCRNSTRLVCADELIYLCIY